MKKFHQILQILLLVYFATFLIFFTAFDSLGGIFGMQEITSDAMVKIILLGLIIFLISWGIGLSVKSNLNSTIKNKENEINALKAKIYDYQQSKPDPQSSTPPKKSSDGDGSGLPRRQNIT